MSASRCLSVGSGPRLCLWSAAPSSRISRQPAYWRRRAGGYAALPNTKHVRSTWRHALLRVDAVGNAIFISAAIALLLGLVMGGRLFPWSSWRIILPLVLGFVGLGVFPLHQGSRLAPAPTMPLSCLRIAPRPSRTVSVHCRHYAAMDGVLTPCLLSGCFALLAH